MWEEVANNNLSVDRFSMLSWSSLVEDGPRKCNMEYTIMTKKTLTLVERKLAVLDWFQGTQDVIPNERFIEGIAKDECYTSLNTLNYKRRLLSDKLVEMEEAEEKGQDIKAMAVQKLIDNIEDELALLEERHEADLSVYEQVTGKAWEPAPKRTAPAKMSDERRAALRERAKVA